MLVTRESAAWPSQTFWLWLVVGTMTQIVATGLMLAAMNERSFVVTTAYIKTEPIQAALFGFVFLADHLTPLKVVAIVVATAGVVITAIRPGREKSFADLRPTLLGLAAAAGFALSAVGYRGAILQVIGVSFVTAASFTLVMGLMLQTLGADDLPAAAGPRDDCGRCSGCGGRRCWPDSWARPRRSSGSSALRSPASPMSARWRWSRCCSRRRSRIYSLKQRISAREAIGIALIVLGVGLLIAVQ